MKASEWEKLDAETWSRTFREAQAPVLADLARAGLKLRSADDLQHVALPSRDTVDVLLEWLPRVEHPGVKASIARGLADPKARGIAPPVLIAEYRDPDNDSPDVKGSLSVALGVTARDKYFADIVDLIRHQRSDTPGRMFLIEALGKMHDPRAFDELADIFATEPGMAIAPLGELGDQRARPLIEPYLDHPDAAWRKVARTATKKLDRAAHKQSQRNKR